MTFEVSFDYPVSGPRPLIDSLRTKISNLVFSYEFFYESEPRGKDKLLPPIGDELNTLLYHEGMHYFTQAVKNYAEVMEYDPEYRVSDSYTQKIKLIAQSTHYVSYHTEGYIYTGGAHGTPWDHGLSFYRTNGKVITWEDLAKWVKSNRMVSSHT